MEGPAGLEPATWRLKVDVVRQAFAILISATATKDGGQAVLYPLSYPLARSGNRTRDTM